MDSATAATKNDQSNGEFCPMFSFIIINLNGMINGSVSTEARAYSLLSSGITKNGRKTRASMAKYVISKRIEIVLAMI